MGLAASPAVAAGDDDWLMGWGQTEPNTKYDTSSYMWNTTPTDPENGERLYFNGFIVRSTWPFGTTFLGGIPASVPRGTQADGGTVQTAELMNGYGLLGYWRDCNGDGYAGNKQTPTGVGNWGRYPLAEYADEVDTTLCPPETLYNDGLWITEFVPVAPSEDADGVCDPAAIIAGEDGAVGRCIKETQDRAYRAHASHVVDPEVKVWYDLGVPDGSAGESRNVFERGYMQNSTGTIEHVDFTLGGVIQRNLGDEGETITIRGEQIAKTPGLGVYDDIPNVGDCGDGERAFMGGPHATCGLYPLYQAKRLYNDSDHENDREEPIVYVFNEDSKCNHNEVTLFEDIEVDEDTTISGTVYFKEVQPARHPNALVEGSVTGTITNVDRGVNNYNETSDECESEEGWGDNLETAGSTSYKTRSTSALGYVHTRSTQALAGAGHPDAPVEGFGTVLGGYWRSIYTTLFVPPQGGSTSYRFGATFYAAVSDNAFSNNTMGADASALPGGGGEPFRYGSEQCGTTFDSPKETDGNWMCDASLWEKRLVDDGWEGDTRWAVVGQPYQLRDIDCYDGALFSEEINGQEVTPKATISEFTCDFAPYGPKPLPEDPEAE